MKPHVWVMDVPIQVHVQRNEDGHFFCQLPSLAHLGHVGEGDPIVKGQDIKCGLCQKGLYDAFGSECESVA